MTIMRLQVPANQLGRIEKRLADQARAFIRTALEQVRPPAVALAKERTLELKVYDLGRVYRGWYTTHVTYDTVLLKNRARHTMFTESGRRAGARPPPASALVGWVRRHFAVDDRQARGLAFVIARNIARRGIKARRVATSPALNTVLLRMMRERVNMGMMTTMRRAVRG